MADDLDDFFDDIEQAEADAVNEIEVKDGETAQDETEQQAQQEPNEELGPPSKRQKVVPVPPVRPKGVVVAASSSVVTNTASTPLSNAPSASTQHNGSSLPSMNPVGPGYPSQSNNKFLPPLPPGPPPPPPPPLPQPPISNGGSEQKTSKPVKRVAAGKVWMDTTLSEWPENDFRIFVGNLARDVTDDQLLEHFQTRYASTAMAKIVKDPKSGVSKGYGFVSFLQPLDCAKAIREQDQKWLGSRPIRVKRSDWKDRNMNEVQKKQKKEKKKEKRFGGL